jgi:hypothetical protein
MEIAGKYKGYHIIARCCSEGEWFITQPMNGSGACHCNHTGYTEFYDFLEVNKLKEVTDEKIIEQVKASPSYKLYEHRFKEDGKC